MTEAEIGQREWRKRIIFTDRHEWTDQKLKVHGFYATIALMLVSLIGRQMRHVSIQQDGLPLGAKLARDAPNSRRAVGRS